MVVSYEQPEMGEVKQLGFPIKLSRTPGGIELPAPALGEHTADVLAEAGYSAGGDPGTGGVRRRQGA